LDPEPESLLLLFSTINLLSYANGFVLVFLLISSALISGSEVAFFSLSQSDLDHLKNQSKEENKVVTLLESPKKLLATILITNNFVNILIVLLFAALGEALFGDFKQAIFGIQVRFFN
jgi:Mg2+/Co2+ transporter CorB